MAGVEVKGQWMGRGEKERREEGVRGERKE